MSQKQQKRIFQILLILIFLLSFALFVVSLAHLIKYSRETREIQNLSSHVQEEVSVEEVMEEEETEEIEIIEPPKDTEEFDPYWDYIQMNLVDVDFSELKKENSDVVGWIQVPNTNVNYPFVQTDNNDYYLNHAFNKKKNSAGWIFLDSRNNLESLNLHTIIYGHGRYDRTMFGTLKNLLKTSWLKNKDNHIIKISTEHQNTLWQIFSVYHLPTTGDYLTTSFSTTEEYQSFLKKIQKRSVYDFSTKVEVSDKILTLSTCYNEKEKLVVHAKLIKIQYK